MIWFIESESWFQPKRKYLLQLPRNKDAKHRAFLEAFLMRHLLRTIRRTRQYYCHCNDSINNSLHFLFISERWRWEGFTFFASLWPLPQLAPTTNTKVVNIYQYFSIFLRIFSFIVTIIFRCNGKIQKVARETRRKSPNQVIWWLPCLIFGEN